MTCSVCKYAQSSSIAGDSVWSSSSVEPCAYLTMCWMDVNVGK